MKGKKVEDIDFAHYTFNLEFLLRSHFEIADMMEELASEYERSSKHQEGG